MTLRERARKFADKALDYTIFNPDSRLVAYALVGIGYHERPDLLAAAAGCAAIEMLTSTVKEPVPKSLREFAAKAAECTVFNRNVRFGAYGLLGITLHESPPDLATAAIACLAAEGSVRAGQDYLGRRRTRKAAAEKWIPKSTGTPHYMEPDAE